MPRESKLYDSRLWRKVRDRKLRANPYCQYCHQMGKLTPATVVDHIVPHKGKWDVFIDDNNLQSLCDYCHNSLKKREEAKGYSDVTGIDGQPIDPRHPWNRQRGAGKTPEKESC